MAQPLRTRAALALVCILGACNGHHGAAVATTSIPNVLSPTTTTVPRSTTTSTTLDPTAAACSIDDLDVAIADPDSASAGQRVPAIAIRNHSNGPCNFEGNLVVQFLPSVDGPEMIAQPVADAPHPTITLLSCGKAWATIDYREYVGDGSPKNRGQDYDGARASLSPGTAQVKVLMTSALTIHHISAISPFTPGDYPYSDTSDPSDRTSRLDPTRLFTVCPGR